MKNVEIDTEFIRLDQALKLSGVTGTGGESKFLILEGRVQVNGETEIRRGRKLYPGDTVASEGETFVIKGS